jgi:hypothetical protein
MSIVTDYEVDREKYVSRAEPTMFQQLEWIPIVSNIVGTVRGIFGAIQVVVGIFTLAFEFIYAVSTGQSHIYLIAKGAINILRGVVAEICILGNIALYLYDTREVVHYRPNIMKS